MGRLNSGGQGLGKSWEGGRNGTGMKRGGEGVGR